ncbi:hypothetical protein ACQCSU_00710 [Pseudarthrobacter sp. O4]|uniref:hypothetical protein n=1 Tax=Pseudarthrobacter sp. O4 TaxID=3418417 RepID=UPI003CF3EF2D
MKTLRNVANNEYFLAAKNVVTNEYFPAAAVLFGVVLFWILGLFGGLSLLSSNQTLLTTLSWLLFVYTAAVLSPLAGLLAVLDLARRWRRNRQHEAEHTGGEASV